MSPPMLFRQISANVYSELASLHMTKSQSSASQSSTRLTSNAKQWAMRRASLRRMQSSRRQYMLRLLKRNRSSPTERQQLLQYCAIGNPSRSKGIGGTGKVVPACMAGFHADRIRSAQHCGHDAVLVRSGRGHLKAMMDTAASSHATLCR